MSGKIRITPAKPCCDSCVLDSLTIAGFDYHEPFVVYSNLASIPASARRTFVEQLISNAEGGVALLLSTPVPFEFRQNEQSTAHGDAAEQPADESAAPSAEELAEVLGLTPDEQNS